MTAEGFAQPMEFSYAKRLSSNEDQRTNTVSCSLSKFLIMIEHAVTAYARGRPGYRHRIFFMI